MYGWAGKILRINLDDGSVTTEDTSKYLEYTGGIGFGYKVIFDEAPMAGPFDPENRIVFAVGPLTGSLAPSSGRSEVISISPHVYAPKSKKPLVTRSGFGGYWGAELKFAGYDALVVQGKARKPVFINVVNDEVTIEDASAMWGKDTFEAQDMIKAKTGDEKTQIAVIGPSGENLVRISPIIHRIGNAAGQGGFGAVMGSKNLKAIAIRGTKGVQVADKKNLIKYVKSVREFQPGPLGSTPLSHGPLSWTEKHIDPKDINKQALRFDQTESCAPWLNKYHVKSQSCYSCPQGCYSYMNVDGMGGGAVSCTQWFYSWLGNRDKTTFLANQLANKLGVDTFEMFPMIQFVWFLQDEKVDGKSLLDHMYDKKLVSAEIKKELENGHYTPDGVLGSGGLETLMNIITYRTGYLGDTLAEGFCRAMYNIADKFESLGMPEVARHVTRFEDMEGIMGGVVGGNGGWGMSAHYDPRTFGYYWAVNFAVENRDPNRHSMTNLVEWTGLTFEQAMPVAINHWGRDIAENALNDLHRERDVSLTWNGDKSAKANAYLGQFIHYRGCVKDSLTVCDWVFPIMTSGRKDRDYSGDISVEYKLFELVTGQKMTQKTLDDKAARIWVLHRLLTAMEWGGGRRVNLREEHDQLPEHFFAPTESRLLPPFPPAEPPHPPLIRENFEAVKDEYYRLMEWDEKTGMPTRRLMKRLGMDKELARFEKEAFALPA
ncbi:MAG: aldehyde ferredoxin oxidoreductase N-terminal domain-containing protein [Pseudodesulfovibrio sp.]|uniref:aldehyde ferredoxin oxidoreductase N-terminal domain-containing protein n=1 Tax=Pseudodesulfovibrio sp. TaxID=2035812 RepID=UPI003D133CEC